MGRFLHQFGLDNTLFSIENRLCFASTPTPPGGGTTQPPEGPVEQAARIAELETELAPLRANTSRTAAENARMTGIEAELAALRTPSPAATPTAATENAGEQRTIDDLRRAAAEAGKRSEEKPPFYRTGHIPLEMLDGILNKMVDPAKKDPENPAFDADTIRIFDELKKDIRDYDFVLEHIGDVSEALAKIKEDDRDAFTKALDEREVAMDGIAQIEEQLSASPPPDAGQRSALEQKKEELKAALNAANGKLHALNNKLKTGPINPQELQKKIDDLYAKAGDIFKRLGTAPNRQEQFKGILWQEYEHYFKLLRAEVSQEREKTLRTILEKIDAVLVKRLQNERTKWENCKPELQTKKADALKMLDEALKDIESLKTFEALSPEDRMRKIEEWREWVDKNVNISQEHDEQLKRLVGKPWPQAEYDAAVARRKTSNEAELKRCKELLDAGKYTQKEHDDLVEKENEFHKRQLQRFESLLNHGWTQADYESAVLAEKDELKRETLTNFTNDPLKIREMMARSITAHEQSTELENASKEEQEKALGVTDEVLAEEMGKCNDDFQSYISFEDGLKSQINQTMGRTDIWHARIQDARRGLQALGPDKIEQREKEKSLEELTRSEQAITVADDGATPFHDALKKFETEYVQTKDMIASDLELLKNPTLLPQHKKALMDKVKKNVGDAKAAVEQFQKTLTNNFQFFENRLPTFINEVETAQKGKGQVKSIQWLDINAIYEIWKKVKEYVKHRYERKTKERIGIVGEKLFNYDLPILGRGLGQEFRGVKEAAERDAVETEKKNLTNADAWEIRHHMHQAGNKDVLKGMIELLAERGRLRFDDPFLWKQLNKYQKKVYFNCDRPTDETRDYIKLETKIQKAMGYIWEFEFFNNMKRKNDSSYKSKKDEYKAKCDTIAEIDQDNGLSKELVRLLEAWDTDHASHMGLDPHTAAAHNMAKTVDPHLYEEVIEYGITKGKMTPEEKIFYLIQGVSRGLLSFDRISYFDSEHLNTYAILEVFASGAKYGGRPILQDYVDWQKEITESSAMGNPYKPGPKFQKWFWIYAMHKDKCVERINKAVSQGIAVDHDDVTPMAAFLDEGNIDAIMIRQGNKTNTPATGVDNICVGLQNYIDTVALYYEDLGQERACNELKRWIRTFVRFDAIGNRRMYTNATDSRQRFVSGSKRPRSNYLYNHGGEGWNVNRYLEESRHILQMIDPDLYRIILNSNTELSSPDKVKSAIQGLKDRYGPAVVQNDPSGAGATIPEINDHEKFYIYVGAIIENILNLKGNEWVVNEIFEKVRANLVDKNGDVLRPEYAGSFTETAERPDRLSMKQQARVESPVKEKVALFRKHPVEEENTHH